MVRAVAGLGGTVEDVEGILTALSRHLHLVGPKLTSQLCVALGQLHENKGSYKGSDKHQNGVDKHQDWSSHRDKTSDDPSLFVTTVLRGLVLKWAPRMRAMELVETVMGVVALSKASGQGLARTGLTPPLHDHKIDKNDTAAAAAAVFRMGAIGGGGVGLSGYGSGSEGGMDWHSLWDGLESPSSTSSSGYHDLSWSRTVDIIIDGVRARVGADVGIDAGSYVSSVGSVGGGGGQGTSVSVPLSSLSQTLVSLASDELARALEAMLFFGLGAGSGVGLLADSGAIGPGAESGGFQGYTPPSGGVGLGLLIHPRHRDLSICLQLAVMQTLTKSIETLAHPRATPARTEAWIIRSTRLLRSMGAVCGGWIDWDPTTRGHLAKALQNNATLVALYGVLASPIAGAGPSVSVRLSTRTEFLLALGGLRVPIFKPPVHTTAQTQTQTQCQIPSTSKSQNSDNSETTNSNFSINDFQNNNNNINNNNFAGSTPSIDAFEGRSRAIYRHLCVTLLALLPTARETGSRPRLTSGPGLGRVGANPCPRRVYASLVLALWGTHYRPVSTKDGLLRALLYHNGAR